MRTKNAKGVYQRVPMEIRFWEKVDRSGGPDGCWMWKGAIRNGYGYITDFWQKFYAHRYSYELAYAPIPEGRWIQVLHSCDVMLCVNPKHLWLGTARANLTEAVERRRMQSGESHWKSKLTEDNVRDIRQRYAAGGITQAALGAEYDIPQTSVSNIVHRNTWKYVD